MKKGEVELIILKVTANDQDAIHMKIYKDGTTCRYGVGGLPEIGIGMMSFVGDSRYFEPLLKNVPEEILEQPINREEPETPNGYLEYMIAFYGVSSNKETGERAKWTKSTGVRFKLDQQTQFKHPIMGFLDGLTMDAAELTNELYFDVIMNSRWGAKSSSLPKETLITQPKTEKEIQENYENYINQMVYSARKWDMTPFVLNKTYEKDGFDHQAELSTAGGTFSINFKPLGPASTKKKKSWWKF